MKGGEFVFSAAPGNYGGFAFLSAVCWKIEVAQFVICMGFPDGSVVQKSSANVGDASSIPGSERSPREGNGNPLQYSCLGKPMDRGAWQTTVHGVERVGHDLVTKQQQTV